MFCAKCGNEIEQTDTFCSKCGASIKGDTHQGFIAGRQIDFQLPGVKNLHGNAIILLLSAILLLICTCLTGTKAFQISYSVWFATETLELTMFENAEIVFVLFIIGYLASTVVMLLPLKTGKLWEKKDFIPATMMPILGILAFFISLSIVRNKLNDGGLVGDIVEFELTICTGAWVFLLVSAISEILIIKTSQNIIGAQIYWSKKENAPVKETGTQKEIESNAGNSLKEGWSCACGRKNAHYVSTCACGRNKSPVKGN